MSLPKRYSEVYSIPAAKQEYVDRLWHTCRVASTRDTGV